MDNKVQNLVLKILMVVIIGVGALLTYWVTNDDNPYPMKPEQHLQWTYAEWNDLLNEKGMVLSDDGNSLRKIGKNEKKILNGSKILRGNDTVDVFLSTKILIDNLIDKGLEKDSIEILKAEFISAVTLTGYLGKKGAIIENHESDVNFIRNNDKLTDEKKKKKVAESSEKANKELLNLAKDYNKETNKEDLAKPLFKTSVDSWTYYRTDLLVKIKKQILFGDVSKVIGFTRILLILAVVLIVASFIYLITIDYVKALRILAGVLLLGLFMVVCYYMASDQVPVCIAAMEGELEPCQEPLYTSANWKIASAAILTTVVLIIITVLAWISGPIMKLFR